MVTVARALGKTAKVIMTAAMVAVTAGAMTTATENHGHTGGMIVVTTAVGEIEVVKADPHGIPEGGARGVMAPPHRTHVKVLRRKVALEIHHRTGRG